VYKRRSAIGAALMAAVLGTALAAMGAEWNIDFQGDAGHGGTYGQTGPAAYSQTGVYWNVLEVAALTQPWPTRHTPNPSLPLRDAAGNETGVTFSLRGDAFGWAGRGEFDPLLGDYLIFTAFPAFGVGTNPIWWEITGLAPNTRYCLTFYHTVTGWSRGLLFGLFDAGKPLLVSVSNVEGENAATACVTSSEEGRIVGFVTVDLRLGTEGDWSALSIREGE